MTTKTTYSIDWYSARFFERTKRIDTGCLMWTGSPTGNGYGEVWYRARKVGAHVFAWFLETGEWPSGVIRHQCDFGMCVDFAHLLDGTQAENVQDMHDRGRASPPPIMHGEDHARAKLTNDDVLAIRAEYVPRVVSQRFLAAKYGVCQTVVKDILHRKIWTHI